MTDECDRCGYVAGGPDSYDSEVKEELAWHATVCDPESDADLSESITQCANGVENCGNAWYYRRLWSGGNGHERGQLDTQNFEAHGSSAEPFSHTVYWDSGRHTTYWFCDACHHQMVVPVIYEVPIP